VLAAMLAHDGFVVCVVYVPYNLMAFLMRPSLSSIIFWFLLLWFAKVLRKSKLSEPPTRRHSFCQNAFTTTKNKSYFIKLVNRTIKQILLCNFEYIAA